VGAWAAVDFAEETIVSVQTLPTLCLVRHGETAWTISGQHTGHTDIPLTEKGEQAARALAPRLQDWNFTQVFTSPLLRARRTAELAGFGDAVSDADLMEWDYGTYEGRRTADIRAERPGWKLFEDGCPGGEPLDAVAARADRVISRVRACPGDMLVFAHRDTLRILAARWIALPAREARGLDLAPASISLLGYHHGLDEPIIRRLNDGPPLHRR
jgi:probable phosphoglycerate mutase